MHVARIIGIVLVVVGVILLVVGWQATDAPAEQITETFTGRYTDKTMWYLIGGVALAVLGGLLAAFSPRLPK
jgi:drug/metabolite transporter (DMT)-like permease